MKPKVETTGLETEIKSFGIVENKWVSLKKKMHSVLLSPSTDSTLKTPEEHDAMSQFEAQSRSIVGCDVLWAQFQMEARDKKISTTAGVREMLKLKQAEQQCHENNSVTGGGSTIDSNDSMTLRLPLKQCRFSESDISAKERRSSFGSIGSFEGGRKNEFPGSVRQLRRYSSISECSDYESGDMLLPYLPTKSHDIEDYSEAIRGNTSHVLSLYGSLHQDSTDDSTPFAFMFRSRKAGWEQKQVDRQPQDEERHVTGPPTCTHSNKELNLVLRSALKSSEFAGSDICRQRRPSCGVGIPSVRQNEFSEVVVPPRRPFFLDDNDTSNNASNKSSTIRPPTDNTTDPPSQSTRPQARKESKILKSSEDEQDSDANSSDDDDKSNNGCFEYYPCRSRQRLRERSMRSSATSQSSIESSLFVCKEVGDLKNGCYEHHRQLRGKAVDKSMRSSVTSWSSVGSSLLVEWDDCGESSDDSD